MKTAIAFFVALAVWSVITPGQSGPFSPAAAVTIDVQPAIPVVGSDFTVSVRVNLEGVTGHSSDPAALGGFVIPVAFDNSRVTLKAVAGGSASNFASGLTYTDIQKANARGYVTIVNAHTGAGTPTGRVHIATLTFAADQGGTVQFNTNSARARWEGSLTSTFDPELTEGPEFIAYADAMTLVDIQQRDAPYRLIYPSLVSTSSDFQGVAIVNESLAAATLTFRAFGADGALLAGTGMTNPNTHAWLAPHAQYVKVVEEMFSLRDILDTDRGWIEVESTSPNTSGFFLIGRTVNGITTELDGVDVSHALTARAIFPVLGKDAARGTKVSLVNPEPAPATGSLKLQKEDGTTQLILPMVIPARGVFEQTFQSTAVPGDGYIEVDMSSGRVAGLERFGNAHALACLAAQDVDKAANTLYAPHLASGEAGARYFTEIHVINTSPRAANADFHLLNDDGKNIVSPVVREIEGKAQLRIRADRLFGLPDPATADGCTTGAIMVESDRELVGSITFGDVNGGFLSSLPLLSTSSAKRELHLDLVALGTVGPVSYWTGVALMNASRERDARVVLSLYKPDGQLVGQTTKTIPKKGRLVKLVSELDPSFNTGQFGGFLRVTSDVEVFALMLFGDRGLTFVSAVPAR
jgi:hypothetical protein